MELHFWAGAIVDFFPLHFVIVLAYNLHMPGIKSVGKLCGSRNHLTFAEHHNFEFLRSFPPREPSTLLHKSQGKKLRRKTQMTRMLELMESFLFKCIHVCTPTRVPGARSILVLWTWASYLTSVCLDGFIHMIRSKLTTPQCLGSKIKCAT